MALGEMVYCPEGSAFPLKVSIGFFSIGGTATTRTGQQECKSFHQSPPASINTFHACPSTMRTKDTVIVYDKPPQQVDVDYHIDPEDQFLYDFSYPPNL